MASRPIGVALDGEPVRQDRACPECGRNYRLIKALIRRDGDAYAIAFIALHRHSGAPEAWIDVILGTFGMSSVDDHVTFGCRVGPIDAQKEPTASLVAAAVPYGSDLIWGQKLSREQALGHPRLAEYWAVVDYLLLNDSEIHSHVYGPLLRASQ